MLDADSADVPLCTGNFLLEASSRQLQQVCSTRALLYPWCRSCQPCLRYSSSCWWHGCYPCSCAGGCQGVNINKQGLNKQQRKAAGCRL